MKIQDKLRTLLELDEAITVRSRALNSMKKEAKKIRDEIAMFLKSKNEDGVRYNEVAFVLEDKTKNVSIKPSEKKVVMEELLRDFGVSKPADFIAELKKNTHIEKGETKLKIKRI